MKICLKVVTQLHLMSLIFILEEKYSPLLTWAVLLNLFKRLISYIYLVDIPYFYNINHDMKQVYIYNIYVSLFTYCMAYISLFVIESNVTASFSSKYQSVVRFWLNAILPPFLWWAYMIRSAKALY